MSVYLKPIASTGFLVGLLYLSILLGFVVTFEQERLGPVEAIDTYIHSFFVFWNPSFVNLAIPVFFGGYTLIALFTVSLFARIYTGFELNLKQCGGTLINMGAMGTLIGYLIINATGTESQLLLKEGNAVRYADDVNEFEFVLTNVTGSETNRAYSVPQSMLERSQTIRHSELPFAIRVDAFMINSIIRERNEFLPSDTPLANQGRGKVVYASPIPKARFQNIANEPSALITIFEMEKAVGAWLVKSGWTPQKFEYRNRQYTLQLRPKRHYLPFSVELHRIERSESESPVATIEIADQSGKFTETRQLSVRHPIRSNGHNLYLSDISLSNRELLVNVKRIPGKWIPTVSFASIVIGALMQLLSKWPAAIKEPEINEAETA